MARELLSELSDPDETLDAIDVISAYSHEHGRPALVERIAKIIRIAEALPAPVHHALCRLPIDVMMTTNFDTLLEQAFAAARKPCHVVLDEPQLAITNPYPGPTLLKVHGDLSRPERLVLTEEDFDTYLARNPLLATVISSHFAQRSIVLIGYSLSDPDLRQLLGVIRERLGEGARAIYSIEVSPTAAKVARFARRHVRTVALPGDPHNPAPTLEGLFKALFSTLGEHAQQRIVPKTHESGLALRKQSSARACFLAAPIESQADYYEWLGPVAAQAGAPLLSFQDFVAPGESLLAAVDTMLAASGCAIVEYGSQWTSAELGMALARLGPNRVFVVSSEDLPADFQTAPGMAHKKPRDLDDWASMANAFAGWLTGVQQLSVSTSSSHEEDALAGRIVRLAGELEVLLAEHLGDVKSPPTLGRSVLAAQRADIVSGPEASVLREFVELRNRIAHGQSPALSIDQVDALVGQVQQIIVGLHSHMINPSPQAEF